MNIKFGTTTNPLKDILKELSRVTKNNFDFVEISVEPQIFLSNVLVLKQNRIKKILQKKKMFIIVHAPWNTEFGNTYAEIREGWVDVCKEIIEITKPLGLKKINVHLYSSQNLKNKNLKNVIIKNSIESLKKLVKYGRKKKVEIVLETMPGREQIYKINDIKKILNSVKSLWLTFDSGHCFVNGRMNYTKKFLSSFKNKITHVHLHDNHGGRDEHLSLGKGKIDFKFLARFLKKMNYSNTITFEIFHGGNDKLNAVKSRKYFQKLLMETS